MFKTESQGSLFIANPFLDIFLKEVPETFLDKIKLKKGTTGIENDPNKFKKILEKALAYMQKANMQNVSSSYNASEMICAIGGSGTNVMRAFSNFDHKCTILGRIGDEETGKAIETHISDLNVVSLLIKSSNSSSGRVLCFITPDNQRTMLAHYGATTNFTAEDISEEKFNGYTHCHIEGYIPLFEGVAKKCIDIASYNNAVISLNLPTKDIIELCKETFKEQAKRVDYIVGNLEEITTLAKIIEEPPKESSSNVCTSIVQSNASTSSTESMAIYPKSKQLDLPSDFNDENIQKVFSSYPKNQTVAATDKANKIWIRASGEKIAKHYEVKKIDQEEIKNPVGAGDTWTGIFLALLLKKVPVAQAVEIANSGAAEWIKTNPGVGLSKKTWKELNNKLKVN